MSSDDFSLVLGLTTTLVTFSVVLIVSICHYVYQRPYEDIVTLNRDTWQFITLQFLINQNGFNTVVVTKTFRSSETLRSLRLSSCFSQDSPTESFPVFHRRVIGLRGFFPLRTSSLPMFTQCITKHFQVLREEITLKLKTYVLHVYIVVVVVIILCRK